MSILVFVQSGYCFLLFIFWDHFLFKFSEIAHFMQKFPGTFRQELFVFLNCMYRSLLFEPYFGGVCGGVCTCICEQTGITQRHKHTGQTLSVCSSLLSHPVTDIWNSGLGDSDLSAWDRLGAGEVRGLVVSEAPSVCSCWHCWNWSASNVRCCDKAILTGISCSGASGISTLWLGIFALIWRQQMNGLSLDVYLGCFYEPQVAKLVCDSF